MNKYVQPCPYADPEAAARKLVEIASKRNWSALSRIRQISSSRDASCSSPRITSVALPYPMRMTKISRRNGGMNPSASQQSRCQLSKCTLPGTDG